MQVISGAKIMVVGSTINDVLAVNTPKDAVQQEVKSEETKKEPLCRQKVSYLVAYMCPAGPRVVTGVLQRSLLKFVHGMDRET